VRRSVKCGAHICDAVAILMMVTMYAGVVGASGLEVSEFASHKDVYTKKMWGFADKLITKEYFEL
jgi:hypothetical protein